MDIMGPYPETPSKNRFIFVTMEMFARWTEAQPLRYTTTRAIAQVLEREIFARYGYPKAILTDNGPQFTSKAFTRYCRTWGTLHWTTAIYHPQANPTERRNQELKKGLRIQTLSNPRPDWEHHLAPVLFNLRCRENAATRTSP